MTAGSSKKVVENPGVDMTCVPPEIFHYSVVLKIAGCSTLCWCDWPSHKLGWMTKLDTLSSAPLPMGLGMGRFCDLKAACG